MTERFTYEILFRYAFPDWDGPIPPLCRRSGDLEQQIDTNSKAQASYIADFDSDDIEIVESDSIKGKCFIWEVISTDNCSNLRFKKQSPQSLSSIREINLYTQESSNFVKVIPGEKPDFESDDLIHFLPNAEWVFSLDPSFPSFEIEFFDPIIAKWLQNTESFTKSEDIKPMSYFAESGVTELFNPFMELRNQLNSTQLGNWMKNVEIPHLKLLGIMHRCTLHINKGKFSEVKRPIQKRIDTIENEIYKMAGHSFNINSPAEVSNVLYSEMGLSAPDNSRGSYSIDSRHRINSHRSYAPTNAANLILIDHPIAKKIMEFRNLQKLISTWLSFDLKCDDDGSLHPNFHVTTTATGRISTTSPNLQNIPSNSDNMEFQIRSLFTPGDDSFTLISLDYCQLELRILAHYSKDPSLIELCQRTDIDIHTHIAKIIFSVENISSVSLSQREEAKQGIYATIYGKGWSKEGYEKGKKLESVLNAFPNIRNFAQQIITLSTKNGYVDTISGKRRFLPNINSKIQQNVFKDHRIAINTAIQGSAADFVKFALINIVKKCGERVEPLLQLHDEWLFRTKLVPNTPEFSKLVADLKQSADCASRMGIEIPMLCKISAGKTYGDLQVIA